MQLMNEFVTKSTASSGFTDNSGSKGTFSRPYGSSRWDLEVKKIDAEDADKERSHQERMADIQNKAANELQEKQMGWFGRLFGVEQSASKNISFVLVILLMIFVSYFVHYFTDHSNSEMSKYMLEMFFPVFTLALGYLFGKK